MAKEGLVIRNQEEKVAVDLLTQAHKYLGETLGVKTNLVFSRECSYGHDSFHAGFYRNSDKQIRINFRNLYGSSIDTMIEVLGHEFRHAVQHNTGMLTHDSIYGSKVKKQTDYISGIWNGKRQVVRYCDAPWEIDANQYQRQYADEVIEALGIQNEVKTILPMGEKTESNQLATLELLKSKYDKTDYLLLSNKFIKDKKITKGGGITFVVKTDLPEGFNIKKREDNAWLYNEGQHIIQFMSWIKETSPYGGFKLTELIF